MRMPLCALPRPSMTGRLTGQAGLLGQGLNLQCSFWSCTCHLRTMQTLAEQTAVDRLGNFGDTPHDLGNLGQRHLATLSTVCGCSSVLKGKGLQTVGCNLCQALTFHCHSPWPLPLPHLNNKN